MILWLVAILAACAMPAQAADGSCDDGVDWRRIALVLACASGLMFVLLLIMAVTVKHILDHHRRMRILASVEMAKSRSAAADRPAQRASRVHDIARTPSGSRFDSMQQMAAWGAQVQSTGALPASQATSAASSPHLASTRVSTRSAAEQNTGSSPLVKRSSAHAKRERAAQRLATEAPSAIQAEVLQTLATGSSPSKAPLALIQSLDRQKAVRAFDEELVSEHDSEMDGFDAALMYSSLSTLNVVEEDDIRSRMSSIDASYTLNRSRPSSDVRRASTASRERMPSETLRRPHRGPSRLRTESSATTTSATLQLRDADGDTHEEEGA
eukprot:m.110977 g.110977  ORF g.110977 m.110977 type:complete len:326 (-) comp9355_c0_seq3:2052-3029(-)